MFTTNQPKPAEDFLAFRKSFVELNLHFLESVFQLQSGTPTAYTFNPGIFDNLRTMLSGQNQSKEILDSASDILDKIAYDILKNSSLVNLQEYLKVANAFPRSRDDRDTCNEKVQHFRRWITEKSLAFERPVALLDVDHTLIVGEEINIGLINALKQKGVRDVFLFSSMSETNKDIKDRLKLIDSLESLGMRVRGVLTDSDPGASIAAPQQRENYERAGKSGRAILNQYLLETFFTPQTFGSQPFNFPFIVFDRASAAFKNGALKDTNQTYIDGAFTAGLSVNRGYVNGDSGGNKGIMYEMFMASLINRNLLYNTIIQVDDAINNLKAVREAHDKFFLNRGIKLVTIHVSKKLEPQKFYEDKLDGLSVKTPETQHQPRPRSP